MLEKKKPSDTLEIFKPQRESRGTVLIIHSWWGKTSSFNKYGEALAQKGFTVGAVDLFSGKIASTAAQAKALRAKPRKTPFYKTLQSCIDTLLADSGDKKISIIGFSMGGHWAIWLSQNLPQKISKVVVYYAARGGTFQSGMIKYLFHFCEEDEWVSSSARKKMETAIQNRGCDFSSYYYKNTKHWFAESDRKFEYNDKAASIAFSRTLDFLIGS